MKKQWLLILLGMSAGVLLTHSHRVSGTQSPGLDTQAMTIRGEVATIRVMQGRISLELGGSWRRRFTVVINEADVLIPFSEVSQRYRDRIIEVKGQVYENRGRFEVHIEDLSQIEVLDPNAEAVPPLSEPAVVSSTWPGDFESLAQEIKKLRRELTNLKRIQREQQQALSRLQKPAAPKIEHHHHASGYADLEHRVHRLEVALDRVIQTKR